MMSFADRWHRKDQGSGIIGRIRDGVRPPPPIKPQIEQANRQIRVLIAQLDASVGRIRQRDQKIFDRVVESLAKHDNQHASVYANELSEVRKIGRMVTQAQLALEQISLRLSTVTDLGEVATTLGPAVSVLKSMKDGLSSAMPEAEGEMSEISGLLSSILVDARQSTGLSLNFETTSEDARKVLDEAAAVAEQRMKESFPEVPASVSEREEQESLPA